MSNSSQPNLVPSQPNQAVSQAARVFAKFGGVPKLCRALETLAAHRRDAGVKRNISAIYRWDLPTAKGGTGGTIPRKALNDVLAAARLEGIVLTPDDLNPLPVPPAKR